MSAKQPGTSVNCASGPSKPSLNHLLSRLFDRKRGMRLNQPTGCKWNFTASSALSCPWRYESWVTRSPRSESPTGPRLGRRDHLIRPGPRNEVSAAIAMSALCRKQTSALHSIISSASASNCSVTFRPSDLAVLMLSTKSYLVGCTTGRSAGFSPLRTRPT
jgi:hypothetical protein